MGAVKPGGGIDWTLGRSRGLGIRYAKVSDSQPIGGAQPVGDIVPRHIHLELSGVIIGFHRRQFDERPHVARQGFVLTPYGAFNIDIPSSRQNPKILR